MATNSQVPLRQGGPFYANISNTRVTIHSRQQKALSSDILFRVNISNTRANISNIQSDHFLQPL